MSSHTVLLRRTIRWLLNLTVLGAVVAALLFLGREHLFQRVNDEIRVRVERLLAEHFHDVKVSVRSARWIDGEGILVRDVTFYENTSGEPMLRIGEVFCSSPIEWSELVSKTPEITRLTVRDAQLKATRQADGQWDVGRLWPPPVTERPIPIDIESATIEVVDSDRPDNSLLLRNVRVEIAPDVMEDGAGGRTTQRVFQGRAAGNLFGELTFSGVQRPGTEQFELRGVISQLDFSRRLFDRLPEPWNGRLQELRGSDLETRIEFQLASAGEPNQPLQYHIAGEVLGGRIADGRLPYTLNNVQGRMEWNNRQLRLINLSAESGATSFNLSCTLEGFEEDSPVEVRADARHLTLDQRVYSALPATLRESWDKFAPTGVIHADLHAVFDGERWTPELHVQCLDVSFAYDRFPYRLTHGQGLLHYAGDRLWSDDFRAAANGQPVEMQWDLINPGPEGTGWLEGRVLGPVPLDERLLIALEDNVEEVVRSFQPSGMVVLRHARFEKRDPHQERPDTRLEIDLHDCAIKFVNFPYPIYNVRGKLLLEDGRWTFRELVGRNDSAYLACHGSWEPLEGGGGVLNLQFDCQSVPLDDELRDALHANAQTLWRKLQPSGTLDKLAIALTFNSADDQLTLDLRAQKWPVDERSDGRNVTLHPVGFPYRLENVTGSVRFHDGVLELEQMKASHAATSLSATGRSVMRPDGQWSLTLNNLMVTQLHLDHDLIAALPANLAEGLESLRLTGPLSVSGKMDVFGQAGEDPPIIADWDLVVDVEDGKIGHADPLENIRGSVRLDGRFDGQGFRSRGELEIDSAMYQGVQVTQIRGPIYLEAGQVLFGAQTPRASREGVPRQVTAQVFDGTLSLDARLLPDDDGRFYVECRLNGADLARISHELNPRPTNVTGKVFAQLRLSGTSGGVHTWRGDGAIRLRDADVYKLPVMIALLKILTVQPPDATAFTTSDVDFRIEGDRFYFNPINFDGDAISLRGRGEMSFQRELNVHFYTLVGRDEWRPAVLRPFLRDASRSLLLIQVGGTLDNPTMARRPFPQIEETLQQIFPEAGGENTGRKSAADPLMQALDPRRILPMK